MEMQSICGGGCQRRWRGNVRRPNSFWQGGRLANGNALYWVTEKLEEKEKEEEEKEEDEYEEEEYDGDENNDDDDDDEERERKGKKERKRKVDQ